MCVAAALVSAAHVCDAKLPASLFEASMSRVHKDFHLAHGIKFVHGEIMGQYKLHTGPRPL